MASTQTQDRKDLQFTMYLSLGIAFLMLVMKMGAYLLTHSAAILSDAAESIVHAAAVCFATYSLWLSHQPSDEEHPYGHAKVSYFSAGFEGGMIILAAIFILTESAKKWAHGSEVENALIGTVITGISVLINAALGALLIHRGKKKHSLILVANGHHTLTDVWTSIGVVVALAMTLATKQTFWDPLCGIVVGLNILVTGSKLIAASAHGLMDKPEKETVEKIKTALDTACSCKGVSYHGLKVRPLGDRHAAEFHVCIPDEMSVAKAHDLITEIESQVRGGATPAPYVISHMEPASGHEDGHDLL